MDITLEVTGTSPLLMHNPRMADPDFIMVRELKALTDKRKKTEQDRSQMEWLEWFGGLYTDSEGKLVQPTSKVRKCFVQAAKITRSGKAIERAISFPMVEVSLKYEGSTNLTELYEFEVEREDGGVDYPYRSRLSVVVNNRRIMRTRPQFYPWALTMHGEFIEDAGLNFDELERIATMAGKVEGIGDNRVNGYGRFNVKVLPGHVDTASTNGKAAKFQVTKGVVRATKAAKKS